MNSYTINTSLIGKLEVPVGDGLYKSYEFELGGQKTLVSLYIVEDFLTKDNVSTVQHFIDQIPAMYQKAKKDISLSASSNEIIKEYTSFHIEELGDDLVSLFNLASSDQLTPELFVNNLEPRTIRIGPHSNDDIDCTFDFSLPEDFTDELLVVSFNPNLEIYTITHES
ncbi:hypothetical protein D3C77_375490 [compost metagenome]